MRVLDGLRVIEMTQVIAGPLAGAILSDLGAEVIKVEKPNGGDDGRQTGPAFLDGDSLSFVELNRGKKSVTIDLKSEKGMADLLTLIESADIVLHNQRPDVIRKLGLDGETLLARFPRLIYCQISGFGHTGPMELEPAYESIVQAYSGLSSINGFPDKPPVRIGASVCDLGTGLWTILGALAALRRREVSGEGSIVDTSLLETGLSWSASAINALINMDIQPKRHGTGFANMVPYQTFDAPDGALVICAGNDRLFAKLAKVLRREDWLEDERFATNRARLIHREALVTQVTAELARGTRDGWLAQMREAGIPSSPVNDIADIIDDPQIAALDIVRKLPDADVTLVGLPLSFDGARPAHQFRSPRLGQHNEWLAGEIKRLGCR